MSLKENKPNIIYVMADQLRYQSCGYAGDVKARTPNIDKLALEGADLCSMVSSMPVCSAYRASLFTGKYTTSTGLVINELRMNPDHECLAHCLTKGGYNTGYVGKWHLWANQYGNHNLPENSYIPPGPYRLGFDQDWKVVNFNHTYYGSYYHENSPKKIFYGEGVYEPDGQTDLVINYINKHADDEEPFALFVSYGTPHDPWEKDNVPAEYYDKFKNVKFEMPPNYSDKLDFPYGDKWSNIDKSPAMIEKWMQVYYAMTNNIDFNIGRLQKAVKAAGIEGETIFVFTSDHGEMFGAQGRMKKNIFYDEAARVPFLMKWPDKIKAGQALDVCMSNVDVMPTLLGLLDLPKPEALEGQDVSCVLLGQDGPEPEFAFLQNTGACAVWENGHEWRAIRDKNYTYAIYRVDGKELLFDNKSDPYQQVNLADNSANIELLAKYQFLINQKMTEIDDNFEECTWYRDNWTDGKRNIIAAAHGPFKEIGKNEN